MFTGSVSIVHHRLSTAAYSRHLFKSAAVALERCNSNDGVTTDTDDLAMALSSTQGVDGSPSTNGRLPALYPRERGGSSAGYSEGCTRQLQLNPHVRLHRGPYRPSLSQFCFCVEGDPRVRSGESRRVVHAVTPITPQRGPFCKK